MIDQFENQKIQRLLSDIKALTVCDQKEIPLNYIEGFFQNPSEVRSSPEKLKEFGGMCEKKYWGGRNSYWWFSADVPVSQEYRAGQLALSVSTHLPQPAEIERVNQYVRTPQIPWDILNPQFLLFVNGKPFQGLDINHTEAILKPGPAPLLQLDFQGFAGNTETDFGFHVYLGRPDMQVRSLYYDLLTVFEVAGSLHENDPQRPLLYETLDRVFRMLDLRRGRVENSSEAQKFLRQQIFGQKRIPSPAVICTGHTHIDVAWLWDLAQTRQKTRRSFSTVLRLMQEYPDYTFLQSSPQLYEFIRETDPDIFRQIQERIREGRWEAEGAMWLEADCNIPSGESLVRQLLYGKRYFRKEFGKESRVLWLPDVFGYSAALPQLLKQAGVTCFITSKISWNMLNRMPYDTFYWQGINGDEILTYFLTAPELDNPTGIGATYNGVMHPRTVQGTWDAYRPKELNDTVLLAYGYGDGGGGPTAEMLEKMERLKTGIPGSISVEPGSLKLFVDRLSRNIDAHRHYLPRWSGELYLELHQGTYTSNGWIKRQNRKAEIELHNTELLLVLSGEHKNQEMERLWKILLLNQFHDTLPGSCIEDVYRDSHRQFDQLFSDLAELQKGACRKLITHKETGEEDAVTVFNYLPFVRDDIFVVHSPDPDGHVLQDTTGEVFDIQRLSPDTGIARVRGIPSLGCTSLKIVPRTGARPDKTRLDISEAGVDTPFYSFQFDRCGNMQSFFDKRRGEYIHPKDQPLNQLTAYEDRPYNWDTWNIAINYEDHSWKLDSYTGLEVTEKGPVRGMVKITRRYNRSTVTQWIHCYADTPRIDFETEVDWHEDSTLLKVSFPSIIKRGTARFDIQFGNIERPTEDNTSWDRARYEVCAHQWMDLSEENWGIAVLNDCKYGCDIHGGILRLSLLKAGMAPWEKIDRGIHRFTYALYVHDCSWQDSDVPSAAAMLNNPLIAAAGKSDTRSFASADCENVVIDTVKKAEDSGKIIMRLHENKGKRVSAKITFGNKWARAESCNLLEETEEDLELLDGGTALSLRVAPFQIISIMLTAQKEKK